MSRLSDPVAANPLTLSVDQPRIGLMCTLTSAYALEVSAGAGFDWILIDTEHSPADLSDVLHQLQVLAGFPTAAVVRVPWNDFVTIKRYLDLGVRSLLVPYVETADQAREAVAATRYPPDGVRGVALATRASGFGRVPQYARRAHEGLFVICQIESQLGLKNLESIASVDGVGALLIGPSDLHASFGLVGETAAPNVIAVIDDAIRRIVATGKAEAGVYAPNEELAHRWIDAGASLVLVGSDVRILAAGSDALIRRYRPVVPHD